MKKKCTKCGKLTDNFSPRKGTHDGLASWCRHCVCTSNNNHHKTPNGLITKIFSHQKSHSRNKNRKPPKYTLEELRKWTFKQNIFHKLYDNWVMSGYKKELIPSIDRIDDYKGYSLDNIQLMTWEENNRKGNHDIRSGKLKHGNKPIKPVIKYDLDGNILSKYTSQSEAERITGVNQASISSVCRGKTKTAGGFIWKFKQ